MLFRSHLCTNVILLRHDNKLYGPFEYDVKEETIHLLGCKECRYTIGVYNSFDYNDDILKIEDHFGNEAVLLLPKNVFKDLDTPEKSYDWISEGRLIEAFLEILRTDTSFTRTQIRQIRDFLPQILTKNPDVYFSSERVDRFCEMLKKMSTEDESIKAVTQYAMSDPELRETLVIDLAGNHFDLIKAKLPEYDSIQKEIEKLEVRKAELESHFGELETSSVKVDVVPDDCQDKIEVLQNENDSLRKNNEELTAKLDSIEDFEKKIEQLRNDCERFSTMRDKAKEKYDQQVIDNNDLEKRFKETIENFKGETKSIAKILDKKLLDRVLRSIDGDSAEDEVLDTSFDTSLLNKDQMDSAEIIERVTSFVREKAHRDVTTNDIANYLICISQGFITTFAGEPGTGKTSICNILAKALGLVTGDSKKRFVDVSVERGWSSLKDFIGYHNPLTKKLEQSNADVFDAFKRMDKECDSDPSSIAPFVILLDEANLSPVEHYWAAFLRNCDFTSVSNRSISLGGTYNFNLPEHLRFLATVNFDHTTEDLSPRFLDRSWVIMLEPTRINDDDTDEDLENFEDMMSFASMKSAFCFADGDAIDESIQNKWDSIQKIFKDHALQIMPRNQKMVRNYCAVACRCMERDTPATKLAPLDYAFSQKILPTINGMGENYRSLIDDLLKECTAQNMPISWKHLERIKDAADNNMGFYQFFSRNL